MEAKALRPYGRDAEGAAGGAPPPQLPPQLPCHIKLWVNGLKPGISEELVSGESGVNPVLGPVFLRCEFECIVEDRLAWDEDGVEVIGELPDDLPALFEFGGPFGTDCAEGVQEWLHEDEFDIWKNVFAPLEEFAVDTCVSWDFDAVLACVFVPGIVDTDEDAEDIGVEIERIDFPACVEVDDAVSADAGIEDIPIDGRFIAEESCGDEPGVSGSETITGVLWWERT